MCAEKDIQLCSFTPQSHLVEQAFFPFLQIRKMKLQKVIYSRKRQRITQSMSSFYRWKSRALGNRLILLNLWFCQEQVLSQIPLLLPAPAFFSLTWDQYCKKMGHISIKFRETGKGKIIKSCSKLSTKGSFQPHSPSYYSSSTSEG